MVQYHWWIYKPCVLSSRDHCICQCNLAHLDCLFKHHGFAFKKRLESCVSSKAKGEVVNSYQPRIVHIWFSIIHWEVIQVDLTVRSGYFNFLLLSLLEPRWRVFLNPIILRFARRRFFTMHAGSAIFLKFKMNSFQVYWDFRYSKRNFFRIYVSVRN